MDFAFLKQLMVKFGILIFCEPGNPEYVWSSTQEKFFDYLSGQGKLRKVQNRQNTS